MKRILTVLCLIFIVIIQTTAYSSSTFDYLRNNKFRTNVNKNKLNIPVLTYHLISEDSSKWSEFCISPKRLEDDFALLISNGYKTISLSELENLYSMLNNVELLKNQSQVNNLIDKYKKSVVLTSDDGYESNFKYVLPLIQKYNIKFNFFIVGKFIDKDFYMTREQIIKLESNSLVEIGNHSDKLHNIDNVTLKGMYKNIGNNKYIINDFMSENKILYNLINIKPHSLSYPYGLYSNSTDAELKSRGFELRFTTDGGVACPFSNNTRIGRINRSNSISSNNLIKILNEKIIVDK